MKILVSPQAQISLIDGRAVGCHLGASIGWRAAVCAVFALLAFSARSRTALAASNVEVPVECGSRAELESALAERLGSESRVPSAEVRITREGETYVLNMRVGDEQRRLADPDCRELFRAAVIILAARSTEREAPPPKPAPQARPAGTTVAPLATQRASSQTNLRVGVGGGLNLGLTPAPVFAAELETKLSFGKLGVLVGARGLARGESDNTDGRDVAVRGWGAFAAAVYAPVPALEARVGVSAMRLSGEGRGSFARDENSAWAAGPLVGLSYFPIDTAALYVGAGVEAQLHAVRARFEILRHGEVFRVPPFGSSIFLKVGHQFF